MNEQDYPPLPKAVREVITLHQPTEYTEHVVTGSHYTADQMRDYADAAIAQQGARHAEELAAYELTVSNMRAQGVPDAVLEQALEATQTIRDFGAAIAQDGYKVAGENLVQTALVIERAMLSSAPAPQSSTQQ